MMTNFHLEAPPAAQLEQPFIPSLWLGRVRIPYRNNFSKVFSLLRLVSRNLRLTFA